MKDSPSQKPRALSILVLETLGFQEAHFILYYINLYSIMLNYIIVYYIKLYHTILYKPLLYYVLY